MDTISTTSAVYFSFSVILATFLFLKYFRTLGSRRKLPPGPSFGLPFLGNVLQLGRNPHLTFTKWRNQYGPLFSVKIASINAVVVSDPTLAKELLSKDVTSGRLHNPIFDVMGSRMGIGMAEGRSWAEQRAFSVRTLKGLSKGGTLEAILSEEAERVVKYFIKRVDTPLPANGVFMGSIMNGSWRLMFGENHDWTDENSDLEHISALKELTAAFNKLAENGAFFAPWIRHVIPDLCGYNTLVREVVRFRGLVEKLYKKNFGENPDNFLGKFMALHEREEDPHSSFYKDSGLKQLVVTTSDIFGAATDTTSSTLDFALLFLSKHPRVQVEMQKEVDTLIGSRPPSLADKLPYTEAVIQEILRKASTFAMGFPHRVMEDMEFQGYFIPKNTTIFTDAYGIHHDVQVYGDPQSFRPERWLNEDKSGLIRYDAFLPFLVGKRVCIGENMARATVFLILTCLMQKFTIEPDSGKTIDLNDVVPGFLLKPKPFKVVFKLRN